MTANRSTRLVVVGSAIGLVGLLLAWASQLLHLGLPGMADAGLDQIELLRDALLGVLLPACATAALGRLATEEAAPSEVLARVDVLSGAAGLAGAAALVASSCFGAAAPLVLGGGIAVVALALVIDALGILGRTSRLPTSFFATSVRAAAFATLFVMPLVAAAMSLVIAEHFTHLDLLRGDGADAWSAALAIRDAMSGFAPIALLCAAGAVMDALLTSVEGAPFAASSTRAAFHALALFGAIAASAKLFGGGSSASLAVASLFQLALVVPGTVIAGNLVVSIHDGKWKRGHTSLAALAALVLIVERCALAMPATMAALKGLLETSSLAAAADEIGLVAVVFSVVCVAGDVLDRLLPRATMIGLALFAGSQLALLARLCAALQTRAIPALPSLTVVERVTALGLALGLFAASLALVNALRGLRQAPGAGADTQP